MLSIVSARWEQATAEQIADSRRAGHENRRPEGWTGYTPMEHYDERGCTCAVSRSEETGHERTHTIRDCKRTHANSECQ
jgi:hypothetical protein